MKTKFSLLWLIPLIFLFFGCSTNSNYYKKPIKKWLDQNLNDAKSYEPIEFVALDSISFNELIPSLVNTKKQIFLVNFREK